MVSPLPPTVCSLFYCGMLTAVWYTNITDITSDISSKKKI